MCKYDKMQFNKRIVDKIEIYESDVSWSQFLNLTKGGDTTFVDLLKELSSPFYLELPPVKQSQLCEQMFEFSITYTQTLPTVEDPEPFTHYFHNKKEYNYFWNLSQDCILFIPMKQSGVNSAHLYTFLQTCPHSEKFFQKFFSVLQENIFPLFGDIPVWISTHGNGVPWLHIRVCNRPKYYCNRQYV